MRCKPERSEFWPADITIDSSCMNRRPLPAPQIRSRKRPIVLVRRPILRPFETIASCDTQPEMEYFTKGMWRGSMLAGPQVEDD
jgi:hypothetical protein